MDSYGSSFLSPANLILGLRIGRDKEPSGASVLRLIQIRLATPSFAKISLLVKKIRRNRESLLPFHKSSQLFIRTHNETLSVVAVCVSDPDRSPFAINA